LLQDSFGRFARRLRISVTDRCNFHCQFCMPHTPVWLPREQMLTFEEIRRVVSLLANMGIEKIRLTGGEPLVRRNIEKLVKMLAGVPRIRSISMTTNGFLLAEKAAALKSAGLSSVNVSLHSLKPERFSRTTGGGLLENVLAGIEAAKQNGFRPLKLNAVIIRGYNEDEIMDLASLARAGDLTLRFIEYMPFDGQQFWGTERLVSGREIIEQIRKRYELITLPREPGSTAKSYRFTKGEGEIGLITSITEPFCSDCDRIRLSADGKIVPCLFDTTGYDLKPLIRGDASDQMLSSFIRESFLHKAPGVETLLKKLKPLEHVRPMHTIGG